MTSLARQWLSLAALATAALASIATSYSSPHPPPRQPVRLSSAQPRARRHYTVHYKANPSFPFPWTLTVAGSSSPPGEIGTDGGVADGGAGSDGGTMPALRVSAIPDDGSPPAIFETSASAPETFQLLLHTDNGRERSFTIEAERFDGGGGDWSVDWELSTDFSHDYPFTIEEDTR